MLPGSDTLIAARDARGCKQALSEAEKRGVVQLKLEVMVEEAVGGRPVMTGEAAAGRYLHPCKVGGQEREARLGPWDSRAGELHPN